MRRVAVALIAVLAFAALAGAVYQAVGRWRDSRRFPEPGQLVDVGGYRLKLDCTGEGKPTVVLEAGLGGLLDSWERVQPEIAKFARVCSYDRAGYGGSDSGPMPRTSEQIATELHTLLHHAGEQPPYLLVGHSFGGYNVRVFNGKYPDEVAGIVLVDATQEDQYERLPKPWPELGAALLTRYRRQARWAPLLIDFGLGRFELERQGVPAPYLLLQAKYFKARGSELEFIRRSAEQARAADHIDDKPLVVLTAGKNPPEWVYDLQMRLAHLSRRGKRLLLPDSEHDMPADRPDAIVEAVRSMEKDQEIM